MHMHIHTHTQTHAHTRMHARTHARARAHTHTHISVRTHARARTHAKTQRLKTRANLSSPFLRFVIPNHANTATKAVNHDQQRAEYLSVCQQSPREPNIRVPNVTACARESRRAAGVRVRAVRSAGAACSRPRAKPSVSLLVCRISLHARARVRRGLRALRADTHLTHTIRISPPSAGRRPSPLVRLRLCMRALAFCLQAAAGPILACVCVHTRACSACSRPQAQSSCTSSRPDRPDPSPTSSSSEWKNLALTPRS
jgi:hypothetical protein